MRYKATISYYGENYVGWQRQKNGLSVQECVETALSKIFGVETSCTASGRTDAGVHALGQVIHFDAETNIPTDKIPFAVNTELPDDISMLACEVAPDDFNARFSAKRKTYSYSLYYSQHRLPMLDKTHAHLITPPDVELMKKAAELSVGTHDFKCFEAAGSAVKTTVRTIYSLEVEKRHIIGTNGNDFELIITVCGNGFLYNMVRILAGTLVYVGAGKLTVSHV
ncbi:MAG: tRNA pseudouridine(38-40) synthase TruA, partial [Clostridia bacterium]|nr:tRNA pseudouridine(38-40) synthase TruA [Clostridia bacterium]